MTVTETNTATATATAGALVRAMANTELFASRDDTLPMLCCLHLTAADGTLTVESTDRYVLAQETVPGVTGSLDIVVNAREVLAAVRPFTTALKDRELLRQETQPVITITVDGDYARFTLINPLAPDHSVSVPLMGAEWILNAGKRFTPWEDADIDGRTFSFTAGNLAKLAKVTDDSRIKNQDRPVRFTLTASGKPAIAHIGERFRALVMTVRNAEAA